MLWVVNRTTYRKEMIEECAQSYLKEISVGEHSLRMEIFALINNSKQCVKKKKKKSQLYYNNSYNKI